MRTVQLLVLGVPAQSPPQPVNILRSAGVAVSVTEVFSANEALCDGQDGMQLMPAGALTTVPCPALITFKVNCVGA